MSDGHDTRSRAARYVSYRPEAPGAYRVQITGAMEGSLGLQESEAVAIRDELNALDLPRATPDRLRDQHVVKVTFQDYVPDNHMRDLIRHIVAEFGLEVIEECEWRDPEGGIALTIYPEATRS